MHHFFNFFVPLCCLTVVSVSVKSEKDDFLVEFSCHSEKQLPFLGLQDYKLLEFVKKCKEPIMVAVGYCLNKQLYSLSVANL
jgi:hypothetical protein